MLPIRRTLLLLPTLWLASCGPAEPAPDAAARLATEISRSHGAEAWQSADAVRARVQIDFGGKRVVDGRFTLATDGSRVRYDRADGAVIIWDGSTAWLSPETADDQRARFHLLTWPWFLAAPFRTQMGVDRLSERRTRPLAGEEFDSIRQTFLPGVGDSPDDWYLFYAKEVDGRTVLDSLGYIVTYGKSVEEADANPSVIRYRDYVDVGGAQLATRYELWHYDPESGALKGEGPKATGTVTDIEIVDADPSLFERPADARELTAPAH